MIFLVCVPAAGLFLGHIGVVLGYFLRLLKVELEFGLNMKVVGYRLRFPTTPNMLNLEL